MILTFIVGREGGGRCIRSKEDEDGQLLQLLETFLEGRGMTIYDDDEAQSFNVCCLFTISNPTGCSQAVRH